MGNFRDVKLDDQLQPYGQQWLKSARRVTPESVIKRGNSSSKKAAGSTLAKRTPRKGPKKSSLKRIK